MTRRYVLAGAVLLGLVACSSSQLISTLRAVVIAAEIALPIIGQASGAPPFTIAAINRYLQGVGKATAEAADILAGAGSSAEKSARIVQSFSGVAVGCQCLGPGTPSQIAGVVNAVAQAVVRFLANFPRTEGVAFPSAIEVGPNDNKELAEIRQRSEAVIGAIVRKQ